MKTIVTNPEPDRFPEPVKHKSNLATIYRTRNRSAIRYEVRWHDDQGKRLRETFPDYGDAKAHAQPRPGGAHLAGVEEHPGGRTLRGGADVGVVEGHVWRLAAELEAHLLEIPGSGLDDELGHLSRAGERQLGHIGMRGDGFAGGFSETWKDVEHARRLGQRQSKQGFFR